MHGAPADVTTIDTLLGGWEHVMAAHLVAGPAPALIDPGARTSAPTVRAALAALGLGPRDLRWIVLTHVHLDHCGATGILARAFPEATVVVHRRGARHLAEPLRLVAGTAAVHGARWSLYGGLDPTPADRIVAADDGHRVDLGGGALVMVETPGHARHHMSVLDERTGTLFAGDAVGARVGRAGLYPALPPPDIDPAAGDASLERLGRLAPERLHLAHGGAVDDPAGDLTLAREQLAAVASAARAAGPGPGLEAAIERALPLAATVGDAAAVALWRALGWAEASAAGLRAWLDPPEDARTRQ